MNGIDYSFARPSPAQIKAKYQFVCRYLASDSGKRITEAETKALQAESLAIVLVFEDLANQALKGRSQGIADAKEALSQANSIGFPSDRPIYFAVDFDVQSSQMETIGLYFEGVASVIGKNRTGGYGGYPLIKYLFDNKLISYGWQTVAWSGGKIDSRIHIYQNGNTDFSGGADIDEAKQQDYGQWETDMITWNAGDTYNFLAETLGTPYADKAKQGNYWHELVGQERGQAVFTIVRSSQYQTWLKEVKSAGVNKQTALAYVEAHLS